MLGMAATAVNPPAAAARQPERDVLLIGEAGVPQVDVHVDEGRGSHQSGGFDDLVRLLSSFRGQQRQFAVLHQDIPTISMALGV